MKKLTALVVLGLLAACDDIDAALARRLDGGRDDGGTDGGSAPVDGICRNGFCWEYPLPQVNDLKAVWGKNASDVWMVGSVGTVFHWNGTRLENHSEQFPATAQLNSVWSNGDVVLVVGQTEPSSPTAPMRPRRLLADGGWVDEMWADASLPPQLLSIRGNGLEIQAVGAGGVIAIRSSAGVWWPRVFGQLPSPSANVLLSSVAFDDAGTCLIAATVDLHGIGPCNGGALELTFDAGSDVAINGMWSTGPGIFHAAVTKQISPLESVGQLWRRSADGSWTLGLDAGYGCAAGFAQGAVSVAQCGNSGLWRDTPPTPVLSNGPVGVLPYNGLWTPPDTFEGGWLVGGNGAMLRNENGQWTSAGSGVGPNFSGLWVDTQTAVVTGDNSLLFDRSEAAGWTSSGAIGSVVDMKDLWIAPGNTFRVYVGIGRRLFEGAPGSSMQAPNVPLDETFMVNLNAVWGTSQDDLWAVGNRGEIWHRDATGWSRNMFFPDGGPDLFDIDGNPDGGAYIVGQGCVVLRRDVSADGGWLNIKNPACADDLYSVWAAPQNSANLELITVGAQSNRGWLHSTDGGWTMTDPKGRGPLLSVWGTSPTDIYAAGEDGLLSHSAGGVWEVLETGTRWPLRSVRGRRLGTGQLELFLIGENATILRALRP